MKEKIETAVLCDINDDDHTIEIIKETNEDVIDFVLDGKQVFGGDWSANFGKVFKRALELWGEPKEAEQ